MVLLFWRKSYRVGFLEFIGVIEFTVRAVMRTKRCSLSADKLFMAQSTSVGAKFSDIWIGSVLFLAMRIVHASMAQLSVKWHTHSVLWASIAPRCRSLAASGSSLGIQGISPRLRSTVSIAARWRLYRPPETDWNLDIRTYLEASGLRSNDPRMHGVDRVTKRSYW